MRGAPAKELTPAEKAIKREKRKLFEERNRYLFLSTLKARSLPTPRAEVQFALELDRKWCFDYAIPEHRLAIEQEGLNGRHQFTGGFVEDLKKYRAAALLGWFVARFTVREMTVGVAADWIEDFIRRRGGPRCAS